MADKIFTLAGQGLKLDSRADVEPHVEKLRAMEDVEEIHLGGNTFGVEACQALAEVLETKKTLKVADLADIFTSRLITEIPTSLSALCDALISHPQLHEINLSDNAFGGRSAEPMVRLLSQNTAISVLKLNNNGLGPAGGEIVARALLASAEKSAAASETSNLKVVVCGRNRLEDSAKVFAEAFAKHGTLREVTMQNDGIRMSAMLALVEGLSHCPDLELLDLADNTLTEVTDSGAIDLAGPRLVAKVLPRWKNLQVLNLSDCVLKPRGGVLIAQSLAGGSNPGLRELKFENSEIDPKTFGLLAEAISRLPEFTLLELNANRGDAEHETLQAIREALKKQGKEDALGELDEMEEIDEEEEEEEYVEVFPEAEEAEKEEGEEVVVVQKEQKEEEEVQKVTEELAEVKLDGAVPPAAAAPVEVFAAVVNVPATVETPAPVEAPTPAAAESSAPAPVEVPAPAAAEPQTTQETEASAEPSANGVPAPAPVEVPAPAAAVEAATAPTASETQQSQEASTHAPEPSVPAPEAAVKATAVQVPVETAAAAVPPKTTAPPSSFKPIEAPAASAPPSSFKPVDVAIPPATENGTATTSNAQEPETPAKGGSWRQKGVRRRKSILGGLGDLGDKIVGVFSPKRRVSNVPK
ncbi:RNI-like protein [Dacryopinax primogenitus]|uniref:RNI-like protein n=1 Tax=Dacryopinax primogenitus (strain DJM 731) TaxID=1858805 RepID=M5G274_DACPD|nr:RNI-like protein [Dacryopinax primogenitus]EJT99976.1 RNI-like protein [Dacryopinax primogenitus]